jgi:hypothetical protein
MKKDIIFYSNYCSYSKEIINQLAKTPIHDNIIYVCVDDDNIQLPQFVKAVPTIYLVNDKKIVVDEAISGWIKDKISKPKDTELQAYYGACDNSYGGSFSTIDDSENKPFISSFTFLGDEQKIETPNGENVGSSNNSMDGKQNSLSNSYDKMQQNRTNEFNLPQRR